MTILRLSKLIETLTAVRDKYPEELFVASDIGVHVTDDGDLILCRSSCELHPLRAVWVEVGRVYIDDDFGLPRDGQGEFHALGEREDPVTFTEKAPR